VRVASRSSPGDGEHPWWWQYFRGYAHVQQALPLDPSSLVKCCQRVGLEGIEKLLASTATTAQRLRLLKPSDVAKVNVARGYFGSLYREIVVNSVIFVSYLTIFI